MGAWIDANPGLFFGLLLTVGGWVVYIVRMEGKVSKLESRVGACERRAEEDRNEIKDRLDSVDKKLGGIGSKVDRLLGAFGQRIGDHPVTILDPERL